MSLSENHLKQMHGNLPRYSRKDERHRGEYKKLDNHVVANHPDGTEEISFHTASPFDTPRRMAELVTVTNDAFVREELHGLLIAARFIVNFLSSHPTTGDSSARRRCRACPVMSPYATLGWPRTTPPPPSPSRSHVLPRLHTRHPSPSRRR